MSEIKIERPSQEKIDEMRITDWSIWEKEESTFDWFYDSQETCYILEGNATVEPHDSDPVEFGPGDLVTFPKGMKCVWKITKAIRKHYMFE